MSEDKKCSRDVIIKYDVQNRQIFSEFKEKCGNSSPQKPGEAPLSHIKLPDLDVAEKDWDNLPTTEREGVLNQILHAMKRAGLTRDAVMDMAKFHLAAQIVEQAGYRRLGMAFFRYSTDLEEGKSLDVSLKTGRVVANPGGSEAPGGYAHKKDSTNALIYLELNADF